ncbi:hypothetical protein CcaverHIS002_0704350 [Cutaneotrichosporon cavernicola]|nr:hypothetical protein CcaverHIS002_0704350 [Cutaneotrichosporon cavernicola]
MRLFAALLVATAALAAPERPAVFKRQLHTEALPLHLIPASCDAPCKYYKELFTTCSGNPGAPICAGACNGTLLTDLQVCINCALVDGPAAGVIQFEIDLLNKAQQQLAQECVEEQFPASFSGSFPRPHNRRLPLWRHQRDLCSLGPVCLGPFSCAYRLCERLRLKLGR